MLGGGAQLGAVELSAALLMGQRSHPASNVANRGRRPCPTPVPVRDDLRALEGYHSPQVDVEVRLNTNESPFPPPAAWRDELAAAVAGIEWHRYPDRAATGLRAAIADWHGVRPPRCSPPTDRTRCCRRCCSRTPGRGAPSSRSSRRTSCTATSPASPARRSWRGSAGRLLARSRRGPRRGRRRPARRRVPVLAEQPDRAGGGPGGRPRPARRGARPRRRRRGVRPVRRLDGARPGARRRAAVRRADVLQDVEHGRGPARLRGRARRGWSTSSRRSCCRTTSTRPSRAAGRLALRHVDEMDARVKQIVAERERLNDGLRAWTSTCSRAGPTSSCSGWAATVAAGGHECGSGWSSAACSCATARAGRASTDCLRVTMGTPAENDRFLAALPEVLA